jgi:hypothetical protein
VRVSRLQFPQFEPSSFSLAFEIGSAEPNPSRASGAIDSDSLIVRNPPNLRNDGSRHSTVPILTLTAPDSSYRFVAKIETTLLT